MLSIIIKKSKSKILIIALTVLVLCSSLPAFAADLPLNYKAEELEQFIGEYVRDHNDTTAAVSIALFTKDVILFENSYGYADIENNLLNNTVFDWGSITKLLVWISVMQLAEEGLIDLNRDIRTYLPANFFKKLNYDDHITMIHLMNHTPGWQNIIVGMGALENEEIKDLGDALKAYEPAQVFRPGEFTAYSNYGTAVAGYIVEYISGKPFYEYVHENIFTALDMNHTALKPDLSDNQWVKERREELVCYSTDLQNLGKQQPIMPLYPAGQATGSISDLRKFAQALLPDEDGMSLLFKKAETLAEIYTPTSYYIDGKTARYHHGFWGFAGYQNNIFGHAGNSYNSTMLVIDPVAGVGAVVMANQLMEGIYNYQLLHQIFGAKDFSYIIGPATLDISGFYAPSVNIFKGILKFTGLLQLTPVSKNSDGTLYNPLGGYAFTHIGAEIYKVTAGDVTMPAYATISQTGKVEKISMTPIDFLPKSKSSVIFEIISLLSFVISAFYGLITLIVMLVRKLRKNQQPMGNLRAIVCGSVFIAFVNFVILLFTLASPALIVHGLLFILCALVPVAYLIILIMKMKNIELTKNQKRQLIITSIMGLLVTFNIVYWEFWMFWV